VVELILATKDHRTDLDGPLKVEKSWIVDADLIGFARDWRQNAENIRREFAHVSDGEWVAGRRAFLEAFAARRPFYCVPANEERFGDLARRHAQLEMLALSNPGASP